MGEGNIVIVSYSSGSLHRYFKNKKKQTLDEDQNKHSSLSWFGIYKLGFLGFVFKFQTSLHVMLKRFPSDLIMSGTYKYPFLGFLECLLNINVYWSYVTPIIFLYFLTTTIVAFYYLLLIFPILLGNLTMVFGVFGIMIAVLQAILEINTISLFIGKRLIFNEYMDRIFEIVLIRKQSQEFLTHYKKRYLNNERSNTVDFNHSAVKTQSLRQSWIKKVAHFMVPVDFGVFKKIWSKRNDKQYWLKDAFPDIGYFILDSFKLIFYFFLSNVPIIGPVMIMFLTSAMRTRNYMSLYFKISGFEDETVRSLVHEHYGQFVGFGIVAAFFESIPYFSLLGAVTNQTGAALWSVALIKKKANHEDSIPKDVEVTGKNAIKQELFLQKT